MTGGQSLRERIQRIPLPPWHERLPLAFWRGSTTGSKDIDLNSLELNRRYQLARLSRTWPDRLDARINQVVQCRMNGSPRAGGASPAAGRTAERHDKSLACRPACLADRHRRQYEFLGLLWKLLSGSCILRVQSPRQQWYHQRLRPWVLVPVSRSKRSGRTARGAGPPPGMCSNRRSRPSIGQSKCSRDRG